MSDLGITFDENNAEESEFAPVPDGWYEVSIEGAEVKDNGSGWRGLSLKLQIISDDCAGRYVFGNVTIDSTNETAKKIGKQQMTSLRRACSIDSLSSSSQLIDCIMSVKVGRQKSDPDRNEIRAFKAPNEGGGTKPSFGGAPMNRPMPSFGNR